MQQKRETTVLLALVFFGGFANLATEIIGPRMFASIFGTSTTVWAVIISVTLVGLSAGYSLGGRLPREQARQAMPRVLIANALWLMAISWLIWMLPAAGGIDIGLIGTMAMAAFFVPSTLFGMLTPMTITILSENRTSEQMSPIVGNLYALSTVGSVLGALSAALFWIPWVGLTLSLRLFAIVLVGFAAYFLTLTREKWQWSIGAAALILIVPQPGFIWSDDDGLRLVEQREGYYQTVRVYTDDERFIQMHLGPTFHSRIDLETREPTFSYALNMTRLIDTFTPDLSNKRALIIGGAGHGLAHWFENRGAQVVEVEIDPVVVALSDEHFGEITGEVVVMDGRVYIEQAETASFDFVILDAFDGGTGVPAQLTSKEFYEEVERVLKPEGAMFYNFIGSPEGRLDDTFVAMSSTLSAAFPDAKALFTRDDRTDRQNILFVASPTSTEPLELSNIPTDGRILTDDRNPIEILFERSKEGFYFQR